MKKLLVLMIALTMIITLLAVSFNYSFVYRFGMGSSVILCYTYVQKEKVE